MHVGYYCWATPDQRETAAWIGLATPFGGACHHPSAGVGGGRQPGFRWRSTRHRGVPPVADANGVPLARHRPVRAGHPRDVAHWPLCVTAGRAHRWPDFHGNRRHCGVRWRLQGRDVGQHAQDRDRHVSRHPEPAPAAGPFCLCASGHPCRGGCHVGNFLVGICGADDARACTEHPEPAVRRPRTDQ